jgi:hypothetical protein
MNTVAAQPARIENVPHALQMLDEHRKSVETFYDDPMTQAMGVPTGDFQEEFDTKERQLLFYLIENAHGVIRWDALAEVEKFLP